MRFARFVFIGAGVWGVAVLTPFFWLVDVTGRHYAPPSEYPHFFYGFLAVAMAWQVAFLVIGSNPIRFRPLMLASMVEKLGYVLLLAVLHGRSRISFQDAQAAIPDFLLCILFVLAFVRTPASARQEG